MQDIIVSVIIVLALAYAVRRLARVFRRRDDCGCGCGGDCPNCPSRPRGGTRRLVSLAAALVALSAMAGLPRALPAARGVSADALARMVNDLTHLPLTELHHLVIVKDGHVVAEVHADPFSADDVHNQFSSSKTLMGLAVGLAVQDGLLSVDDRVADLLPDKCPLAVTPELRAMTVRHLLTLTAGKRLQTSLRDTVADWAAAWLALPGRMPGERFAYDTMSAFMLSAIISRVTGRTALDYLQERLLGPMGIGDVEWEMSPDGISAGGWGVRAGTESMAMLGQLLLQEGRWNGRQLVAADWVGQMTRDQLPGLGVDGPTHSGGFYGGYGYQTWIGPATGAFRAQGNFGQLVYVLPRDSVVVAVNAMAPDLIPLLRVVQRDASRLAHDRHSAPDGQRLLAALCGQVGIPPADGQPLSRGFTARLGENRHDIETVRLTPMDGDRVKMEMTAQGVTDTVTLGFKQWARSRFAGCPPYNIGAAGRFSGLRRPFTVAGCHARRGDQVVVRLQFVDWYSGMTLVFDTARHTVTVTDSGSPAHPELVSCDSPDWPSPSPTLPRAAWLTASLALMACLAVAVARATRPWPACDGETSRNHTRPHTSQNPS